MAAQTEEGTGRDGFVDALALIAVVGLTALPYIGRLGFSGDDWGILARFHSAAASGQSGIAASLPAFGARPLQGISLAILYSAFGLRPLGYHLANTIVIAGSVVLLYLLLLRLRLTRLEAFVSAFLFALMPPVLTIRVWTAAFQISLSLLLMLASMHALLFAGSPRAVWWTLVAVLCALLCAAAYEIFIPLTAGFALALLLSKDIGGRSGDARRWTRIAPASVLAAMLCSGALKLLSARASESTDIHHYIGVAYSLFSPRYDWRVDSGLNVLVAARYYSWDFIRHLGASVIELPSDRAGLVVALVVGLLAWWRLRAPAGGSDPKRLLLFGLGAFLLGNATFIFIAAAVFAPSGIGNRTLVAAAIGFSMLLVAIFEFAARAIGSRNGPALLRALLIVTLVGAAARTVQIERYWAEVPALQQPVLNAAAVDLKPVVAGSTVILDGICPYHGPAIVFETYWDVAGALSLTLGKPLKGDVVSPRMWITPAGLRTSIYEERQFYPFGPDLFIYDPRARTLVRLHDLPSARGYFARPARQFHCPEGFAGHGVPI